MRTGRLVLPLVMAAVLKGQIDCTATGTSIPVRAEAVTDRVGDIEIRCVRAPGFDPGSPYVVADFRLYLSPSVNITNRVLTVEGAEVMDGVLTVNSNGGQPTRTSTLDPDTRVPVPQYGALREEFIAGSANLIIWAGVRVPVPEADRGDGTRFPIRTTIRITNVRMNVAQLGLPTGSSVNVAVVSLATQLGSPIRISTPAPNIGLARPSFRVSVRNPSNSPSAIGLQCQSRGQSGDTFDPTPAFRVRVDEEFAEVFRPLGTPSAGAPTAAVEAGFPTPDSGSNGGAADSGTRILLRFSNVQNGVRIGLATTVVSGSVILRLVNTDFNGAGPFSAVTGGTIVPAEMFAGFAFAVYEVVAASAEAVETVEIPVMIGYTANPGQNVPSLGTMTVNANLAPLSTVAVRSRTAPVPRFVDTAVNRLALTVNACGSQPVIQLVEPATVPAGSGSLTLRIGGAQFAPGAVILFEGVAVPTEVDALGRLTVGLTAAQLVRPRTARLQVRNPDASLSNDAGLTIVPAVGAPAISFRGVISAGRDQFSLAPGGIASAYGANLATTLMSATATPLPRVLAGTRVIVDDREAPLYFVSPSQINFQVPFETRIGGDVQVYVTRGAVIGPTETANVARLAPAFLSAGELPAVVHSDYQLITPERPALPGEDLIVFGTGGGGFRDAPASGAVSPGAPPSITDEVTEAFLGAFPSAVTFSGLAPSLVGVTQWNVRMPAIIPSGQNQFLWISYPNRQTANRAVIPVRSNSAPAERVRFTITGPASARRGQTLTLTFTGTQPGNASGAYVCTLLVSRTQPFVPSNDSSGTFALTIEAGGGEFSLGLTVPPGLAVGTYFFGITTRDEAGSSPLPAGFPIEITN